MRTLAILTLALLSLGAGRPPEPALSQERVIELPAAKGRIDHLAFDRKRRRLVVAELGSGAVEVLDLASGAAVGRIAGLMEPQGVAVLDGPDLIAVATGGDGKVRLYHAADLSLAVEVSLGDDADNLRIDPRNGDLVAGYGSGALAVIDPAGHVRRRLVLPAHPEGFQLQGARAYVNLPNANQIVAADLDAGRIVGRWGHPAALANFPMALDAAGGALFSVYRLPGRLAAFSTDSGRIDQVLPACGDSDDVFLDARRSRIYVICGEGRVQVFSRKDRRLALLDTVVTSAGARTGLFIPDLDRLIVAARAEGGRPARLLVFAPAP